MLVACVAVGRTGVIGCVFVAFALSACGGSPSPETQIRHSFQRLLTALRTRDAHTVCEVLFPFGQHQQATVGIAPRPGLANPMTFVRAAGEWRLLIGVQ